MSTDLDFSAHFTYNFPRKGLKDKMRVRLSPGIPTPAWCKSSTFGSQPEDLGALPGAGAFFITFYSSKVEHPADNRETEERYLVEGPFSAV